MPSELDELTAIDIFTPSEPKKQLDPLPAKLDGHSEETVLEFTRCTHKKAIITNGELRCPCGAAWRGAGIDQIYQSLQS